MQFDDENKNAALNTVDQSGQSLGEKKLDAPAKPWGKKQWVIFGSVTGACIIAFIIWVVSFTTGKNGGGDTDDSTNPMIDVFNEQPDFSKYTQGGKGVLFTDNLWNQANYGGSYLDPIRRTEDEETEVIDSGVDSILFDLHASRGEINGLFNITNIKQTDGNSYYDIQIYNTDMTMDQEDELNSAQADPLATKQMADLVDALTGYVRVIKFLPTGTTPDGKTIDPNQPAKNTIQEVFEGYWENGGVSKDPKYGRYFTGDTCYLGFFSYDTKNLDYRFLGLGLNWKADGQHEVTSEGIYNLAIDAPETQETIYDFRTNKLPE